MPEILHEQKGLVVRRNDHNGFVVCELHYTADPAKQADWWAREAAQGMPPTEFEREYNLKFITASGEKVFPEFSDNQDSIVVPQSEWPEIPEYATCYGGFDFGLRNQTSFHVYTVLDTPNDPDDGERQPCIYAIWEHYATTTSLQDLAEQLTSCPYWGRIKWIAADRHLQSRDQINLGGVNSKLDQLVEVGIGKKMVMAPSDESDWIALIRDYWHDLPSKSPKFRILSCCPAMIKEFDEAVFQDMSEGIQANHNLKEKIRDKNNHALDDCKYFMLLGPRMEGPRQKAKRETARKVELWRRHML